jgi:ABC-type sugar transport system substrate-binding protein
LKRNQAEEAFISQEFCMRYVTTFCAVLMLAFLGGCGEEPQAAKQAAVALKDKTSITIALLPKKKGIAYFTSCAEGAEAAAKAQGNVTLIYDGPTDGSPEKAASMIEKWTLKGVDVIAVSPNDPQVLAPAMKAARAKGIKVITWDADGAADTRSFFINQATSEQIASAMVEALVKDIGSTQGQVAIITATLTAANQSAWIEAMKAHMADKYPQLELVAIKPCNEDQKIAFQVAQDLMKTYPDLKGMFGISSVAFPGAAEAIKQAGKSGHVQLTGLSTPNAMRNYIKDGTVKSVILWDTKELGQLTVLAACALMDGTLQAGDKEFKAGTLGPKPIAGDHILLNNLLVFTKENIDQYDF